MTKQQLTWEERKAIMDYKSSYAFEINRKLRNEEELSDWDKDKIETLDRALSKVSSYADSMIIRTVNLTNKIEDLNKFMELHKEGKIVLYPAYTSFSTYEKFDEYANIFIVIKTPKYPKDIRGFGDTKGYKEYEVLYKRNSKFKVVSNDIWNDVYWIELEEI